MTGSMMSSNIDTTIGQREVVSITSGTDTLSAWWYPADNHDTTPAPTVVLAHGFGAVKHMRLWAYAERFAQAGMNVLVFDYRTFGESTGTPRCLVNVDMQLEDWRAAIAYTRARGDVDAERVALWGSSFSGGLVTILASEDPKIAAVVAQVPLADGSAGGSMTRSQRAALGREAIKDALGARFGRPPRMLKTSGAPGDTNAVLTSPDALQATLAMVPEGAPFTNEVCARIILRMNSYKPYRFAAKVRCPFLVQVMDHDVVTPPSVAASMAAAAPKGVLMAYAGGHFTPYLGDSFERVVADQVAFLEKNLSLPGA